MPADPLPCAAPIRSGKAKYDPKRHALVWKLKKFPGETEHTLAASVELIATTRDKRPWSRPPLSMSFQVREARPPEAASRSLRVRSQRRWKCAGACSSEAVFYLCLCNADCAS